MIATWVIADDAAPADALATALFFTGARRLAEAFPFAYVRMLADGRAEISPNFDGELFTQLPADRTPRDVQRHSASQAPPADGEATSGSHQLLSVPPVIDAKTRNGATALRMKVMTVTTVGLSACAAIAGCSSAARDGVSPSPIWNSSATAPGSSSSRGSKYADGTYTATGQYGNLPSSIGVSVTLVDGVITAARVTPHATNPTSRGYQDRFAEAVPALVVGKDIDEVKVSRVAGSSGCPIGFNDAIEKIKAEAAN